MVERRRRNSIDGSEAELPQALGREAPASGRSVPYRSADRARGRDPVRPVPAQHVPRPRRRSSRPIRWRWRSPRRAVDKGFDEELQPAGAQLPLHAVRAQRDSSTTRTASLLLFTALGDDEHAQLRQAAPRHHRALRPVPASKRDARPGASRRRRSRPARSRPGERSRRSRRATTAASKPTSRASISRARGSTRSCSMPRSTASAGGCSCRCA